MNKICVLTNTSGGLYLFRKELLSKLILSENKVDVFTADTGKIDELSKIGVNINVVNVDRRGINPIKDVKLLHTYFSTISKERPDLVITYTIKPNIYGGLACRVFNIKYTTNITGLGTAFQKKGLLRSFVKFMYRISLKKAKSVFFENSENMQLFIDEKIITKKQACLLNGAGVNLECYTVLDYPDNCDITRFLFIGRVMKEKGIDELFEVMKRLVGEGVNCSLDVLGGYEEDYEDVIKEYESEGWLHYHGYQNDVRPFIKKCHCFVLPSWHEGMANTNLECAASGRPVITSNIAGCKEAVIDGKTGFLAEKQNINSLYIAMKKMIDLSYEQRKDMGLSGRMHMENVFDKNKVVEMTIAHF